MLVQSRKKCPSVPQARLSGFDGFLKINEEFDKLGYFHPFMYRGHSHINTLLISFWFNYENPVHLLDGS